MLQRTPGTTQPCTGKGTSLWAAQQLPRRGAQLAAWLQHGKPHTALKIHTAAWHSAPSSSAVGRRRSSQHQRHVSAEAASSSQPGGQPALAAQAATAALPDINGAAAAPLGLNGSSMVSPVGTMVSAALTPAAAGSQDDHSTNGTPDASALIPLAAAAATSNGSSSSSSSASTGCSSGSSSSSSASSSGGVSDISSSGANAATGTLLKRVVFGLLLGLGGAAVVTFGRLPFLIATMLVVYQGTQEYYGFITSNGISKGMTPPPPFVSAMTTALCLSITVFTYVSMGKSGAAVSVAAFVLLSLNVLAIPKPTFSQLATSVFGLFYCGYLPSFWIKLRNISMPGPDLQLPAILGGVQHVPMTIGLAATLTAVACIIAADTGAFFVGKNLGRTKLTDISPKKTVEGALGGMASAVAVALLFRSLFGWPASALAAIGFGMLTFVSSLFGDLIESIMKRDAGMKDSGDLIPGHGGLLDRFDSYIFTGAVAYFYLALLHFK